MAESGSWAREPASVLLGYCERRPHLRVIDLARREIAVAPVQAGRTEAAIGSVVTRDGWIAAHENTQVWALRLPLVGEAILLTKSSFQCLPALNPATVWVQADDGAGGRRYEEVDGRNGRMVDEIRLPADVRIDAVTPEGFVVGTDDGIAVFGRDGRGSVVLPNACHVITSCQSIVLVLGGDGNLVLLDLATATTTRVPPIGPDWKWTLFFASFSPDGKFVAVNTTQERDAPDLDEWKPGDPRFWEGTYERVPSIMTLIEVATGVMRVVGDESYDFATAPVWLADGRRFIFSAPFDSRKHLWLGSIDEPDLQRLTFRANVPTPLADITHANDIRG